MSLWPAAHVLSLAHRDLVHVKRTASPPRDTIGCMNDEFSEPFEGLRRMTEAASRAARDTKRLLDQLTSDVLRVAQLLPDLDELDDLEKRFMNLMIQSDWPPPLDV